MIATADQGSLFDAWGDEAEPEPEPTLALVPPSSPTSCYRPPELPFADAVWSGSPELRDLLRPLDELGGTSEPRDDSELMVDALRRYGQVQPVLLSEDGGTAARGYLVDAARELGWSHLAARLETIEHSLESRDQLSLVGEVERAAVRENGVLSDRDRSALRSLSVRDPLAGLSEEEIAVINRNSLDPQSDWVGLPEFLPVGEPLKLVVSCESEEDRDTLFSLLGIRTIHKGTRGTLSVWWPDREKEDLSSLRFESPEEPEPYPEEPEP